MVHQTADGGVHVAGGHGAHQVKAHVDHGHVAVIRPHILHDAADQGLGQLRTGIADGLAHQILSGGDPFFLQGQHDIKRPLHHRADGLHRHVLLCAGLNHVLLIVQADVRLTGGHQRDGVVGVGREADVHLQALFLVIALLNGDVQEGVQGIGVPVQHHVQFLQSGGLIITGRGAAAAQQHGTYQKQANKTFHIIPITFLKILPASVPLFSPPAPPAPPPAWPPRTTARWGQTRPRRPVGSSCGGRSSPGRSERPAIRRWRRR